ncbi:MAG: ComEC/Rec2 family competence protein, partial [Syntrophales bacterium]|nr:ComEC/Rec2 family competence protein [Syntrophales bacterium]
MKFPLVFLVFFLISGILSGHVFNVCGSLLYEILLISVLCVLFISIRKKQEALLYCCLAVSWILVGMLLIIPYNQPSFLPDDIVHYASGEECIFDGTVIDITPFTDDKFRATVAASAIIHEKEYIPVSGNVRLNVKNTREDIHYGDIIRVKSKLKKPRNFNNPGGFDYVRHLGLRGIYTTASVRKPSNILILRRNGGNAVMRKTEQCRRYFRNLISETVGSPEKEILGALLLGDKKRVPDEILQNFNCSGLSHVLAISGLHVGIIASFSFFIIRCLIRTSTFMLLHGNITKVSACISMVPVVGYAALAGFGISTVRAAIMIATFLLSLLFSRKGNALNSLALAAFIILLFSPSSFFDISFQLSFSAVAAILLLTPRASAFFIQHVPIQAEKFKKVFAAFVTFVMVNIAATLGTAPLIIHTFNSISVITSLSNLLIVPVIGFAVLPIGLAGFLLAPFSHFLALLLIKSAAFFVTLSLMIISYLASLPCSFITISTPHILEIACYYIILLSFVPLDVPIIVRKYNFIKIVCI